MSTLHARAVCLLVAMTAALLMPAMAQRTVTLEPHSPGPVSSAPSLGVTVRDPMQVPLAPAPAATPRTSQHAPSVSAMPAEQFDGPVSFIRVNGKPHLVVGTRLLGVGQMLGQARIERISETELWLREGQNTRKLALFHGVERRPNDAACVSVREDQTPCQPTRP